MPPRPAWLRYLLAVTWCSLTAVVALPLRDWLDLANTVMLFLLVVFLVAVRLGRGPAVATAFLSVALFDVFFVLPHFSFSVADAQYLVTFAVMLAVGLITTHLTAQLAERREEAQAREHETRMLYELARDLGAALSLEQVITIIDQFLERLAMAAGTLIDAGKGGAEQLVNHGRHALSADELARASTTYRQNTGMADTQTGLLYLPLSGATRVRGVLAVVNARPAMRPLLAAVASLLGITIERLHYAEVAQRSELQVQREQLRSSILSALSHDLRTPLTSLVGLADSLAESVSARQDSPETVEIATIIREQAQAMHHMVSNLLEMGRLQSGRVNLTLVWQPFEEIVGSSTRLLADLLARRRLVIDLPDDLPLLRFDAVLMERVLCNLLENAVKYSPDDSTLTLAARIEAASLVVSVCNTGSRFPDDRIEHIFEPFVRGQQEPAIPGTGLGLAVSRAIVMAHGGTIGAENTAAGACIRFTLPLGNPPAMEGEPA